MHLQKPKPGAQTGVDQTGLKTSARSKEVSDPMNRKRSVSLSGHKTSFSLEDEFWEELKWFAARDGKSIASILIQIDKSRDPDTNLSSAIRIHILKTLKSCIPTE